MKEQEKYKLFHNQELSSKILEESAKKVHESWFSGKIADGWKYGPERNDRIKEHPSLVPYEELSEQEKEYDRRTVITTLSFLIDNGFEIKRKEKSSI